FITTPEVTGTDGNIYHCVEMKMITDKNSPVNLAAHSEATAFEWMVIGHFNIDNVKLEPQGATALRYWTQGDGGKDVHQRTSHQMFSTTIVAPPQKTTQVVDYIPDETGGETVNNRRVRQKQACGVANQLDRYYELVPPGLANGHARVYDRIAKLDVS